MSELVIQHTRDDDDEGDGLGSVAWDGDVTKLALADILIWWCGHASCTLGVSIAEKLLRQAANDLAKGDLPGTVDIPGEVQGNA